MDTACNNTTLSTSTCNKVGDTFHKFPWMITKQWFQVDFELDSFVYQGQLRTETILSCSSEQIWERSIPLHLSQRQHI